MLAKFVFPVPYAPIIDETVPSISPRKASRQAFNAKCKCGIFMSGMLI
jgi:hypothetical protein